MIIILEADVYMGVPSCGFDFHRSGDYHVPPFLFEPPSVLLSPFRHSNETQLVLAGIR